VRTSVVCTPTKKLRHHGGRIEDVAPNSFWMRTAQQRGDLGLEVDDKHPSHDTAAELEVEVHEVSSDGPNPICRISTLHIARRCTIGRIPTEHVARDCTWCRGPEPT